MTAAQGEEEGSEATGTEATGTDLGEIATGTGANTLPSKGSGDAEDLAQMTIVLGIATRVATALVALAAVVLAEAAVMTTLRLEEALQQSARA